MSTEESSQKWRVVVEVDEHWNGSKTPCGTTSITPAKRLVAKLERDKSEVGEGILSMPNGQCSKEAQALLVIKDIDTLVPEPDLVAMALMAKAQDLLPENFIAVCYGGRVPKERGVVKFSNGIFVLQPIPKRVVAFT